jgi:hypothetical protein
LSNLLFPFLILLCQYGSQSTKIAAATLKKMADDNQLSNMEYVLSPISIFKNHPTLATTAELSPTSAPLPVQESLLYWVFIYVSVSKHLIGSFVHTVFKMSVLISQYNVSGF